MLTLKLDPTISQPGDRRADSASQQAAEPEPDTRPQQWEEFGHQFQAGELELLKQSIVEMAFSRIEGQDELFVGG